MLQNVTWLAIVAVHTAANELPKVRQVREEDMSQSSGKKTPTDVTD